MRWGARLPRGRRRESSGPVSRAPSAEATQDDPEPQMRPLSEPRRRFVFERPQTLLPLEGLSLCLLPAGGGAAARHGRAGRTEAAASCGGEESSRAGQWWRNDGELTDE